MPLPSPLVVVLPEVVLVSETSDAVSRGKSVVVVWTGQPAARVGSRIVVEGDMGAAQPVAARMKVSLLAS